MAEPVLLRVQVNGATRKTDESKGLGRLGEMTVALVAGVQERENGSLRRMTAQEYHRRHRQQISVCCVLQCRHEMDRLKTKTVEGWNVGCVRKNADGRGDLPLPMY
jgi:hypothetical protein